VQISDLENKIDSYQTEYETRDREVKDREKRAKTAADNLAAAQAATKAAQQTKTQAKSAYDASVQAENQAYLDWYGYTCGDSSDMGSKCSGSAFICYEKSRLYNQWQQSKKQLDKDKKALDAAETALTEKQEAEKEADKKLKAAVNLVELAKMHRDYTAHKLREAKNEKESKIAELIRKETEYAEKLSEVELARVDFQMAVADLKVAQKTYPTEWAETLAADPDLASRIDELFSQFECPFCSEGCSTCD